MTAVPYRFFDTHTHFLQGTPLDRSAEIYKQLFALTNTEKAAFLSLPNSFAEGLGPFQNIEALYFKDFSKGILRGMKKIFKQDIS